MAHTITLIPGDGIGPEVSAVMMLRHIDEGEHRGDRPRAWLRIEGRC